jgi:hypothetical protein
VFIQQNLAHALLFHSHVDKALAIYDEAWNNPLNGKLPLVYPNRT